MQGKVKHKTQLPKNVKQKSAIRINKGIEKSKSKVTSAKKTKKSIQNIVKNSLENVSKQSIEASLCAQAQAVETKSFKLLN